MSYVAVKLTLNQFCNNDVLKSVINDVVVNSNKVIFEACCFANLLVLELIRQNKKIPVLNQDFFQQCVMLVSKVYQRKEQEQRNSDLKSTYLQYSQCCPTGYKVAYRDNIPFVLIYGAKEMATATLNHLTLNFYNRFNHFLRHRFPDLADAQRYQICKGLYDKSMMVTTLLFWNTGTN